MNPIILNNFGRRSEFIQMLAARKCKYGAEIGTDHGKYAEQLLQGIPGLFLLCVDPWTEYTEGNEFHSQQEVDQIYEEAKNRLSPYNAKLMRMNSMKAVYQVNDDYLDFVFIDANHDYEHVLQDIKKWSWKVKKGGIIAGHDYVEDKVNNYGVIEAVNKYTSDHNISPWFVMHKGGKMADCWMFIKQ